MRHFKINRNQSGLVSIMVVSIIIVVLALITIGFSRIMDRELRQSLDRELSSQAYYAAEAGLNDARAYVDTIKDDPSQYPNPNSCLNTAGFPQFAANGDISGNGVVKYTCVLINMQPKELIYGPIDAGQTRVFKTTPAGLKDLYFSWENNRYQNTPQPLGGCSGSSCDLPQQSAVGPDTTGVLRATIYPVYASGYGADPNTKLAADSRTYFFYPNAGGGNVGTADYSQNGVFVHGNCNNSTFPTLPYSQATQRFCNGEITNVPQVDFANPAAPKAYYVSLTALYKPLSVSVEGSDTGSAGSALPLPGAEGTADITGEGNDVLRRVVARIPFDSGFSYPGQSLSSMYTVCKRFRLPVGSGGPSDYQAPVIDDPSGSSFCPLITTTGPSFDIVYWVVTHPVFGNKVPTLVISLNGKIVFQNSPPGTGGGGSCTSIAGAPPSVGRFDAASTCFTGNLQVPFSSVSGPINELRIWQSGGNSKALKPDPGCQISYCAASRIFITYIGVPPGIVMQNQSQRPNSIGPPYGPAQCTEYPPGPFTTSPFVLTDSTYPVILKNKNIVPQPCNPYG